MSEESRELWTDAESRAIAVHDALLGVKRPILLATLSAFSVAVVNSIQEQWVSPIWILVLMFGGSLAALHHVPATFQQGAWRHLMAAIILIYNLVTMLLLDWHAPINDLGCTLAGGAFLGLYCAMNASEACLYLSLHFVTVVLGANLCDRADQVLFLLILDAYFIDSARVKRQACQSIADARSLSEAMSAVALTTVQRSLSYWCVAVLEVKPDLVIENSCSNLPAMLGRLSETKGKNFMDYVYPEDVETMRQFAGHLSRLERTLSEGNLPSQEMGALSVRLSDAYGSPVPVHIFHAVVGGARELPHYLLGITEASKVKSRIPQSEGLKSIEQLDRETSLTSSLASSRNPDIIAGNRLLMNASMRQPLLTTS